MKNRQRKIVGSSVWAAGVAVLLFGMIAVAPADVQAQAAQTQDITFTKHIAPLFQEKCQACHRAGSMAPMSLVTYEETRPWARSIKNRVVSREMPPWHVDKTVGIQHFINDISLTDEQIEMVARWVDSGAPRGNPSDLPPPVEWDERDRFGLEDELGPPDIVVRGEPWTMPAEAQDEWFTPRIDVNLPETVWVRASETKPSPEGRRIAHHSSTYVYQPKSEELVVAERALLRGEIGVDELIAVMQQPGEETDEVREFFTEWATGKSGEIYPENVGKIVRAGSDFEFDTHYHAVGEEVTDTLELGLWLYPKGSPPKYNAQYVGIGFGAAALDLQIEPNSVSVHTSTYVMPAPGIIHNFQPHMHYRGKAQLMEVTYPDGRQNVLNYTDRFDNTWHINYIYDPDYAPVLPRGAVVRLTSWHDNTAANRNNPDPDQFVTFGQRTVDEMAHLNEQVIFITQEDYERISKERQARDAQTQDQD